MEGEEGTSGSASVRKKEIGATSVQCAMLNSTNYTVRSMCMKVMLRIQKAWSVIDPGTEDNEEKNYLAIGAFVSGNP